MAVSMPVTADAPAPANAAVVATDIPARLDRLRWGRFHTLVVVALGITWILDGLEVTLAGAISPALKESPQLRFSNADVGLASSAYLAGAVFGALFFGWLTDRLGRKRLFFITLAVYLVATKHALDRSKRERENCITAPLQRRLYRRGADDFTQSQNRCSICKAMHRG
jgi:hypothetical protein